MKWLLSWNINITGYDKNDTVSKRHEFITSDTILDQRLEQLHSNVYVDNLRLFKIDSEIDLVREQKAS